VGERLIVLFYETVVVCYSDIISVTNIFKYAFARPLTGKQLWLCSSDRTGWPADCKTFCMKRLC